MHVTLPPEYPYKSPSIGFKNRLFHPNVDDHSGSVCLDVINQTWSPMYNLVNIFEMFLPHLLRYPNPTDPLNGEAASLLMRDAGAYAARVRDHVRKHASTPISLSPSSSSSSSSSFSSSSSSTPTPIPGSHAASDGGKRAAADNAVLGSSPDGVAQLSGVLAAAEDYDGSRKSGDGEDMDDGNESDVSEMSDC